MNSKIKGIFNNIVAHWKTPAPGRYVSYKELSAYSVGGMGVQFIMAMSYSVAMSASCWLTGSVYGIKPLDMALIINIATIFNLIMTPLKGYLIDYSNSKAGKSRPWIFWLGPPSAILIILSAFIPKSWGYTAIVAIIGTIFILMNFITQFYLAMYTQLAQLISPNTNERAAVISVSSIIYSLAPTITGAVLPLIASGFDDGLRDVNVYRIAFPVFCLIGLAMSYICYFGTKEKIVISKVEKEKIKFVEGFTKIMKNKYFWINNVNTMVIVIRGGATTIVNWLWVYMLQNDAVSAGLITLMGTASLIGMTASPFLCKFIGKKYTVILTNLIFLVASIAMIFSVSNFVLLFIIMYVMNCSAAVQIITAPAMGAEALDYQQWKTGDRLEGFSQNFGIITGIVAIGTNYIIPTILENLGLLQNYDVLFNPEYRDPIFRALAITSIVGALLCCIPFLFWDMTEKKHAQMIEDLKKRAIEQDKNAGIEESADELEARLAGITVEELLKERERTRINNELMKNNSIENNDNENILNDDCSLDDTSENYDEVKEDNDEN